MALTAHQRRMQLTTRLVRKQRAVSIVYVRTTGERIDITGVRSNPTASSADSKGVLIVSQTDEWRIAASELQVDGVRFLPRKHDRIEETVGDDLLEWELVPPPGKKQGQVYYYSDTGHTQVHCYTQILDTVPG